MRLRVVSLLLLVLSGTPAIAEWTWLYPKPQGHTLHDIAFLDNATAIAVGEIGTALVTHDAGNTWTVTTKLLGNATDLLRVDRVDDNTAVVVGKNGVILRTQDQGSTWTAIASGTTANLVDVSFVPGGYGIAISANAALRSSNGGLSWGTKSLQGYYLVAVDVVTPTLAFAVSEGGILLRTIDGGVTWTTDPVLLGPPTAISFRDVLHGAIASRTPQSHRTADGGATWTPFYIDPDGPYSVHVSYTANEILYLDPNIMIGALSVMYTGPEASPFETPSGRLHVSANGGTTWTIAGWASRATNGLARNADDTVITVGDDGQIGRRDANGTFTQIGGSQDDYQLGYGSSAFLSPDIGIVMSSDDWYFRSGSSTFVRTTDAGQTWVVSHAANTASYDFTYLSAEELIAVGVDGGGNASFIRSIDGGATWSRIWTNAAPGLFSSIASGSPTHAVAVGANGGAVSIDNGVVSVASSGTSKSLYGVAFATSSSVVAVGGDGTIRRSVNGGQTWEPVASGTTALLYDVDFVSSDTGFVAGRNGLLRSDDGGLTWTPVSTTAITDLLDVDFYDADHGMAVGSDGRVLKTDDGGQSWQGQDTPTTRYLNHVTMFTANHAYISGNDQLLLEFGLKTVPTLITSFDATAEPFVASLNWSVRDEADLARFMIRRGDGPIEQTIVDNLSSAARSFRDEGVAPGRTFEYQLVAVDRDGTMIPSARVSVTIPGASLELLPNQPNPFNPSTTIRFVIPERGPVRLAVYDIAGRHVATLVDDTRDAGVHSVEWSGVNAGGRRVASGVYVTRLEAGKQYATRKIVLLK